jgi:hypothetical protein
MFTPDPTLALAPEAMPKFPVIDVPETSVYVPLLVRLRLVKVPLGNVIVPPLKVKLPLLIVYPPPSNAQLPEELTVELPLTVRLPPL